MHKEWQVIQVHDHSLLKVATFYMGIKLPQTLASGAEVLGAGSTLHLHISMQFLLIPNPPCIAGLFLGITFHSHAYRK